MLLDDELRERAPGLLPLNIVDELRHARRRHIIDDNIGLLGETLEEAAIGKDSSDSTRRTSDIREPLAKNRPQRSGLVLQIPPIGE